jgi:hypothetical protein
MAATTIARTKLLLHLLTLRICGISGIDKKYSITGLAIVWGS